MPKVILEFNLPEDNNEFNLARKGADYYCLLAGIGRVLRSVRKYDLKPAEAIKQIDELMTEFDSEDVS